MDWTKAKAALLPNLKPSTQTIFPRLPLHLLETIKAAANARDVPYSRLGKSPSAAKLDHYNVDTAQREVSHDP